MAVQERWAPDMGRREARAVADASRSPAGRAVTGGKAGLVASLDAAIRRLGLTQVAAARLCGTDQPTLSKVLRGRTSHITLDKLLSWLAALGCTIDIRVGEGGARTPGAIAVTSAAETAETAPREGEAHLRAMVEAAPFPFMLLAEDGEILALSRRWLELSGYAREELRNAADWSRLAFPGRGEEMAALSRQAFTERRPREGGEWPVRCKDGETRLWEFSLVPLGHLPDGRHVRISAAIDVTERKRIEAELREAHRKAEEVLESIGDAFYSLDADWRFIFANRRALELWGRRADETLGRTALEIFPQLVGSGVHAALVEAMRERRSCHVEEISPVLSRWVSTSVYPASAGGVSVYFRDIADRKRSEERQALLIAELDHRVKNALAVVQSLVTHAGHRSSDPAAFDAVFGRIGALARAHTKLTDSHWAGAPLRAIVEDELAPFLRGGGPARIEGPHLILGPKAATTTVMIVHELATNAAKYGALSVPGGRIDVHWRIDGAEGDARGLRVRWMESGGPPVAPPAKRGFGSTMIERGAAYELDGHAELRFEPGGLICDFAFPLATHAARTGE